MGALRAHREPAPHGEPVVWAASGCGLLIRPRKAHKKRVEIEVRRPSRAPIATRALTCAATAGKEGRGGD
jgi:hypothetical protein